jgi:hypothetical protein
MKSFYKFDIILKAKPENSQIKTFNRFTSCHHLKHNLLVWSNSNQPTPLTIKLNFSSDKTKLSKSTKSKSLNFLVTTFSISSLSSREKFWLIRKRQALLDWRTRLLWWFWPNLKKYKNHLSHPNSRQFPKATSVPVWDQALQSVSVATGL